MVGLDPRYFATADGQPILVILPTDYRLDFEALRTATSARSIKEVQKAEFDVIAAGAAQNGSAKRHSTRLLVDKTVSPSDARHYLSLQKLFPIGLPEQEFVDLAIPHTIKCKEVIPANEKSHFQDYSCFLGISLQCPLYTPGKVAAMANWIRTRGFKNARILLGDFVHRRTLVMQDGITLTGALGKAEMLAACFESEYRPVFERYLHGTFEFVRMSDLVQSKHYAALQDGLTGFGAEPDCAHNPKRQGYQLRVNGAAGTLGSVDRPSLSPWRLVANPFLAERLEA
jgi:hypothetical protein